MWSFERGVCGVKRVVCCDEEGGGRGWLNGMARRDLLDGRGVYERFPLLWLALWLSPISLLSLLFFLSNSAGIYE
jgi:hypothetical protein